METINTGQFRVTRKVLVIGGGLAGLETSLHLSAKGLKVLLIERETKLGGMFQNVASISETTESPSQIIAEKIRAVEKDPNIQVLTGAKLIDMDGMVGAFELCLDNKGQKIKDRAGAIVLATGFQTIFCPVKYGLGIAENVLGQRKLEQSLIDKTDFKGKNITFVIGKNTENNILPFVMALKNAVYLRSEHDATVNIFYTNIKVCGDSLEALYGKARDIGVRFFKFSDKLDIKANNGTVTISFEDPFLKGKMPGVYSITSDYIVLPEEMLPAEGTEELASMLKVTIGPDNFYGDDNVHLLPSGTNREGIYLVGGCQAPCLARDIAINARGVAGDIYNKLYAETVLAELDQPYVDSKKCIVCLTCYRCCPHGAITIQHGEEFDNMYKSAAQMNPLACKRCGICAAECPGKAVQLPGYTDDDILAQLAKALEG